jgi:NAD(P)-dependent dehydrogenase (short-subunit alcohol dehydrogenase family)
MRRTGIVSAKRRPTAAVYLASAQAGYLTGQAIVVDGGANRSI